MTSLFKPTSYKKGAALAVGATFVWKGISFINALLLALYFGANQTTDVYFYLLMLIGFALAFLQRLNQTVLIPEAMFLQKQPQQTARRFITMWLYIYGVAGILICAVGFFGPGAIWAVLSRFRAPATPQNTSMLSCGLLLFALQIITYYLTAVTEMYKFFKTAWLGILNALCPLVCLLLFGNQGGIISMIYGFLIANILQIVVLIALLRTQLQWQFRPAWVPLRVQTRQNMLTGQTLAVLDIINSWLPVYLISGLGVGLISALNYSRQFTDSTTEVFTSRIANIAKIQLTEQAAKEDYAAANRTFLVTAYALLAGLAPLVVFSCYFAPYIVDLFFKRGHFTAQAAQDTVYFLRPLLFTLLLAVPGYLQNSALAACRKIKEGFPYALISGLLFTSMALYIIPRCGAFSYPYIISAGLLIGFILNAFLFKKHFSFLQYGKQLWLVVRFTLLAAAALVPAGWLAIYLPASCWYQIIGCGIVFVAAYAGVLYLTKDMKKLRQLLRDGF